MILLKLAGKSLINRRTTFSLTVFAIAVSVCLLLGVERTRTQAKESFANTLSGTDLVVGARTGPVQLLLYSVFRIGNATNNMSWDSYELLAGQRAVKWIVPLSLGDSHRGYRVLGTNADYFRYYRYGSRQDLTFREGRVFEGVFEAVIGAEVARKLNYQVGDSIVVAHGGGETSFLKHDQMPFTIVGILKPTATPVDRTVHVSLEGIEAIHLGWEGGAPPMGGGVSAEKALAADLTPKSVTAALVGLNSKLQVFQIQRFVNDYRGEPLMAVLPGVALHELWGLLGVAEQALVVIAGFVVIAGLLGMLTMILSSLNERRREMAILRSVGAHPGQILLLMLSESFILSVLGTVFGIVLFYTVLGGARPFVLEEYGILIGLGLPTVYEWQLLGMVCVAGLLAGLIPSWKAYRLSVADGMAIRL